MIAIDAPSAAPEETPTTPGSASGLPKIACITAPATASAAPTAIAMTMRGKRMTHRSASSAGSGAQSFGMPTARSTEPITSLAEIATWPSRAESRMAASRSTPSTTPTMMPRERFAAHGTRYSHSSVPNFSTTSSSARRVLVRR